MDTPPSAPPIDAVPHFSTNDQPPGLQSRSSSMESFGLLLPAHHEYTLSSVTSPQYLDMKPPTISRSLLQNHRVRSLSPTIGDMYVHINYHSVALLILQ